MLGIEAGEFAAHASYHVTSGTQCSTLGDFRFERPRLPVRKDKHLHTHIRLFPVWGSGLPAMQMPDMPVNVPIDDPNADTEW